MTRKEISSRPEHRSQLFRYGADRVPVEIDEYVPAEDQVHVGEAGRRGWKRVFQQAAALEPHHGAYAWVQLPFVRAAPKVAPVLGRDTPQRPVVIAATPRREQRVVVQVGPDDAEIPSFASRQQLAEQNGQRVRFFAGRAARAPDFQRSRCPALPDELREDLFSEQPELPRVAEEEALVDGERADELAPLLVCGGPLPDEALSVAHGVQLSRARPRGKHLREARRLDRVQLPAGAAADRVCYRREDSRRDFCGAVGQCLVPA